MPAARRAEAKHNASTKSGVGRGQGRESAPDSTINRVLARTDVREKLVDLKYDPRGGILNNFAAVIKGGIERFGNIKGVRPKVD